MVVVVVLLTKDAIRLLFLDHHLKQAAAPSIRMSHVRRWNIGGFDVVVMHLTSDEVHSLKDARTGLKG
jgi:hypothetical protein